MSSSRGAAPRAPASGTGLRVLAFSASLRSLRGSPPRRLGLDPARRRVTLRDALSALSDDDGYDSRIRGGPPRRGLPRGESSTSPLRYEVCGGLHLADSASTRPEDVMVLFEGRCPSSSCVRYGPESPRLLRFATKSAGVSTSQTRPRPGTKTCHPAGRFGRGARGDPLAFLRELERRFGGSARRHSFAISSLWLPGPSEPNFFVPNRGRTKEGPRGQKGPRLQVKRGRFRGLRSRVARRAPHR